MGKRHAPIRSQTKEQIKNKIRQAPQFSYFVVIPAKAGTHSSAVALGGKWVPAFAGMTDRSLKNREFFWIDAQDFALDSIAGRSHIHSMIESTVRSRRDMLADLEASDAEAESGETSGTICAA